MGKEEEVVGKTDKAIVRFDLDKVEIDALGRVIVQDAGFARMVEKLKADRVKLLSIYDARVSGSGCPTSLEGCFCNTDCGCPLPDSTCPPQVSGGSCPQPLSGCPLTGCGCG